MKDYARVTTAKRRTANPSKRLILGIALLMVAIFAVLAFRSHHAHQAAQKAAAVKIAAQKAAQEAAIKAANQPQPVKFDFYTDLPAMSASDNNQDATQGVPKPDSLTVGTPQINHNINDSSQELTHISNEQAASSQTADSSGSYVINAGTFKDQKSANQMRAKLLLMGLQVNIVQKGRGAGTYYVAQLGPYDGKASADADEQALASQDIKGIVLKS